MKAPLFVHFKNESNGAALSFHPDPPPPPSPHFFFSRLISGVSDSNGTDVNTDSHFGFESEKGIILVASYSKANHLIRPMDDAVFKTSQGWRENVLRWHNENRNVRLKITDLASGTIRTRLYVFFKWCNIVIFIN